ncbi:MAG: transposase DNA-binding-containing protein [Flavobacteriales bacterium]
MFSPEFTNCFSDARLDTRVKQMLEELCNRPQHSVRQISNDRSSQMGWYRFLNNDKTSEEKIISRISESCNERISHRIVLCIQDTTEINLYSHRRRIKEDEFIGPMSHKEYGLGFFIHPGYVIDAISGFPYGFSHIQM